MAENLNIGIVQVEIPEEANVVVGQSHFIKTVEDLYEAMVTSAPCLEFGIAFCEASGTASSATTATTPRWRRPRWRTRRR